VPEYTAKEMPLHQIFKSFPTGPSGARQVDFFLRVYADVPAFMAEIDKNNLVPLFFGTGYPVAFFSTAPMSRLEEIAGGKWRSASFWHLDFLRNAGATPVTMHWGPEIYDALKQKSLDGLMVNVDSGYMLKVHEAAPNVLVSRDLWLGHLYLLTMNKTVWNSLAQEDRDAIRRAAQTSYHSLGPVMDKSFDAQLDDLRKAGATVRILDRHEPQRFATLTKYREVQSAWVADQKTKGVETSGPCLRSRRSWMSSSDKRPDSEKAQRAPPSGARCWQNRRYATGGHAFPGGIRRPCRGKSSAKTQCRASVRNTGPGRPSASPLPDRARRNVPCFPRSRQRRV